MDFCPQGRRLDHAGQETESPRADACHWNRINKPTITSMAMVTRNPRKYFSCSVRGRRYSLFIFSLLVVYVCAAPPRRSSPRGSGPRPSGGAGVIKR